MEEIKRRILDIFKEHNIDLSYVPVEYRADIDYPVYWTAKKRICLTANLTPQRFAWQISHEYVHAYFDSPWEKESDTDWREEFVAVIIALTVCKELGNDYLNYALQSNKSIYLTFDAALPAFKNRLDNYSLHPADVYLDNVCLPYLYFLKTGGENAWEELEEVRQYLQRK